jgi:hypothetical protein
MAGAEPEPLAVLVLPAKLEEFSLEAHARSLLSIPRVIALEPPRVRTPRLLRASIPLRQARRLKLPGRPRLIVLYDPAQYALARALSSRYEAELWYFAPQRSEHPEWDEEMLDSDQLARERAATVLRVDEPGEGDRLHERLRELGVISHRPFVPGARIDRY